MTGAASPGVRRAGEHWLHTDPEVPWGVSNCYVDLWLEVLHWLGLDPVACLGFCLASDYRGDQWTFLKPPIADLSVLYGIEIGELTVWRTLPEHIEQHLAQGRLLVTEADAFYLPDARATTYRKRHQKTAIAAVEVDREAGRLGYFHDRGRHQLEGEDLDRLFGAQEGMPPYVELVDLARLRRFEAGELADRARALLAGHLRSRPVSNPFGRWLEQFPEDIRALRDGGEESFHVYAFTHIRQAGAGFQYAGVHLRWLERELSLGVGAAAEDLARIGQGLKALMLRLARALAGGRELPYESELSALGERWEAAMTRLQEWAQAAPAERF